MTEDISAQLSDTVNEGDSELFSASPSSSVSSFIYNMKPFPVMLTRNY